MDASDSPEELTQAILDLSDLEGPDVDEERQSLPVPAIAIDLRSDGILAKGVEPIEQVEFTEPGSPAAYGEIAAPMYGPTSRPDEQLDAPVRPRTVFGADDRWIFYDHNYPFSTVGKVETPRGSCTGTVVGPRHVLTASHCVQWNGDGTTGWARVRPSLYGSEAPFGDAWAVQTYFYRKTDTDQDGLIWSDEIAFDFVVLVLDRYIGNSTGWMGSQTYSTSWNGGGYWANVGYPANLGGTIYPVFQNGCSVTSTADYCWSWWCSTMLQTQCDTGGGQSGGPLYGTWSGSPYVVGVVSAETGWTNMFAGGYLIPTLINQALTNSP